MLRISLDARETCTNGGSRNDEIRNVGFRIVGSRIEGSKINGYRNVGFKNDGCIGCIEMMDLGIWVLGM